MTDTLFLQETYPLVTNDSLGVPLDEALLPSGDLARLYDNGAGHFVLAVFAPGAGAARSQLILPVPEGQVLEYGVTEFATAPNGNVALLYTTATYVPVEDEYGSYLVVDSLHLTAVHVAADGASLSDPIALGSVDGYYGSWAHFAYFDGGGFAFAEFEQRFDADMIYLGDFAHLIRTDAAGSAFDPGLPFPEDMDMFITSLTALPDGRLAVLWDVYDYSVDTRPQLQIYEADGSVRTPPQDIPTSATFDRFLDAPSLLVLPDGLMAVWMEGSEGAHMVRGSVIAADGTPGPALDLSDLTGLTEGYFIYLHDIRVFDDGSFGVLIYSEAENAELLYQRFAADGSALSDPTLVADMPFWEFGYDATALLPDGGAVVTRRTYDEAAFAETLVVRYFDEDGMPMGPETILAREGGDNYLNSPRVQFLGDGSTLFSWQVEGYSSDDVWSVASREVGYDTLPFRPLTEGDDTEILTTSEQVDGLAGDDAITGSDGTDRLVGSEGDDTLDGGAGDDFLFGGPGSNVLNGGAGEDAAYFAGAFGDFTFAFNADGSEITVTGADSSDVTRGIERFDFFDQSLSADDLLVRGGFFDEVATGTANADTLDGGLGDDTLRGEDGDDLIDGGLGRDQLNGGAGDDTILGGAGDDDQRDRIFAGAGHDSVDAGAGNDLVYGQNGNDTMAGGTGVDELFGQEGNDVITGSAWSDLIFGGDGDDFVNGGFGHDRINGGSDADTFFHAGVRGHGSDWLQDYTAEDGDKLLFGLDGATPDEFRVTFAHAENFDGIRPGDADVAEAFIAHVPSGFVVWALVDGAAQDHLWLDIAGMAGPPVDLLA